MSSSSNKERFLSLIEENKGIIYKVSNAYCRNAEDRRDLVQEIIFQLWRSFDRYDDQYKISTWMYRIALNVSISFYRKNRRRNKLSTEFTENIFEFVDDQKDFETEQNIRLLNEFISELKELDRALMILYLEEKSYEEIAEILGISKTNVATKINRIKLKLKSRFEKIQAG
jgi:RNA polymerase sigma-70 factor (ECF subfamily)